MRSLFACLRSLVIVAALLTVTACSGGLEKPLALLDKARETAGKIGDETAEKAALAIDTYCAEMPADIRMKMRTEVNARTALGDIVITCAGD